MNSRTLPLPLRTLTLALIIAFFCLSAAPHTAAASEIMPRKQAEEILDVYCKGEFSKAFRLLTSHMSNKPPQDQFNMMVEQAVTMESVYGPITGYELIDRKSYGTQLKKLTYLVLHETGPEVFKLFFYRTSSGWMLSAFFLSQDLGTLEQ